MQETNGTITFIIPAIMMLFAFICIFSSVKKVQQDQIWTVERLGRYSRSLQSGLHFIVPFIDKISAKVSIVETVFTANNHEMVTQDDAIVVIDFQTLYQVVDVQAAVYNTQDLEGSIEKISQSKIGAVINSSTVDDLLQSPDKVNAKLLRNIDENTALDAIKINKIIISKIARQARTIETNEDPNTAPEQKTVMR